jgi:hypothetical protein
MVLRKRQINLQLVSKSVKIVPVDAKISFGGATAKPRTPAASTLLLQKGRPYLSAKLQKVRPCLSVPIRLKNMANNSDSAISTNGRKTPASAT